MARKNQFPERIYTETTASCSKCKQQLTFEFFSKCKSGPKGIAYWCKACSSKNARFHHNLRRNDSKYKSQKRDAYVRNRHGISLQQYEEKLAAQKYECAICGVKLLTSGFQTHLDHCHKTGMLRDFLCTNCNRGLGHFKDNPDFLERAISYLNTHSSSECQSKEVSLR